MSPDKPGALKCGVGRPGGNPEQPGGRRLGQSFSRRRARPRESLWLPWFAVRFVSDAAARSSDSLNIARAQTHAHGNKAAAVFAQWLSHGQPLIGQYLRRVECSRPDRSPRDLRKPCAGRNVRVAGDE